MVSHVLQVAVEVGGARGARLARSLASHGFTVRAAGGRHMGESTVVEAVEARRLLRALGFEDREYRLRLEYSRSWGFL